MTYNVRTLPCVDFLGIPEAEIATYKWTEGYTPRATAQLIYVPETGFVLRMIAYEENPKTVYTSYNDPVYTDSCLEFFVRFNPDMAEYINFEMNSAGAFLSAFRTDRKNKTPIDKLAPLPSVKPFKGEGFWGVEAVFSPDFTEKLFGKREFKSGDRLFGNFYKCGDETEIPHFGMWSPVDLPSPDFHRPEFFGTLIIE